MDVQRGTFMHRHAVWHDQALADRYVPLRQLVGAAAFDVINSPLAEEAVLGFEYGRSVRDPATLAIWEAQFGDFVNEAQVYLDQYISSGQAKWARPARWRCFCRMATRATAPSIRPATSAASCCCAATRTCGWSARPPRRSGSTCCAARPWTRCASR
jgi:2-oxoglutarate dehydrogenase complex dehydrogenase (E1) component-like enzyme